MRWYLCVSKNSESSPELILSGCIQVLILHCKCDIGLSVLFNSHTIAFVWQLNKNSWNTECFWMYFNMMNGVINEISVQIAVAGGYLDYSGMLLWKCDFAPSKRHWHQLYIPYSPMPYLPGIHTCIHTLPDFGQGLYIHTQPLMEQGPYTYIHVRTEHRTNKIQHCMGKRFVVLSKF